MIGAETPPGRLERVLKRLPEGAVLRGVFIAMLVLAGAIVALDFRDTAERSAALDHETRTTPLPMQRPEPGDQIRPYLPRTMPVGPERGTPVLPGYDGPVEGEVLAEPMRFMRATNGRITALGTITPGTAERFRRFLDEGEKDAVRTVFLHSPGGSVEDAIAIARLIRKRGLSTNVPADGYCASACPLVLAGGRTRAAGDGAWVGVHQVYAVGDSGARRDLDQSVADIQATIASCQELLVDMDVDPRVWVKAMRTPPESLYVMTRAELVDLRMVRPFPDDASFIGPPAPVYPTFAPQASQFSGPGATEIGNERAPIPGTSPAAERSVSG